MKKPIVVLIIFVAALFASEQSIAQFNVGIKVGYNASSLSTNIDTVKSSFQSGFQVGAFVRIGKRIYLQPELYYTTQGGVFASTTNYNNWKQTVKIGSMDIPVLIGFKLLNLKLVNVRILAGPVASFVIHKSVAEGGITIGPITSGDLKSMNWSIQAGAGVDVWKFTLDIRYQIGLNQLVKDVKDSKLKDWNFNSRNNVWVISLGFKII